MKKFKMLLICGLAQIGLLGSSVAQADWLSDAWKYIPPPADRFPNNSSGSLPRPVLFVHGIASDGYGTWGFEKPNCRELEKLEYFPMTFAYTATCKGG